jgi:hypothetical protein
MLPGGEYNPEAVIEEEPQAPAKSKPQRTDLNLAVETWRRPDLNLASAPSAFIANGWHGPVRALLTRMSG